MPLLARYPRTVFYCAWILPAVLAGGSRAFAGITTGQAAFIFVWLVGVGIAGAFLLSLTRVARILWVASGTVASTALSVSLGLLFDIFSNPSYGAVYILFCTFLFLSIFQAILTIRGALSA